MTDVFLADYKPSESVYWQGFLRPYATPEKAAEVFDQYVAAVKEYGGEVEEIEAEGADQMVVSSLYGLFDAVFLKGNTIAGANGSTEREPTEQFAREFARSLPGERPHHRHRGRDPLDRRGTGRLRTLTVPVSNAVTVTHRATSLLEIDRPPHRNLCSPGVGHGRETHEDPVAKPGTPWRGQPGRPSRSPVDNS